MGAALETAGVHHAAMAAAMPESKVRLDLMSFSLRFVMMFSVVPFAA
jgi:hypothetical protein